MDAKSFAREIETHIRPATFPVAVKLLGEGDPLPEKAKRPRRDMNVQIAICQAVAMSRRGRLAFSGTGSPSANSFAATGNEAGRMCVSISRAKVLGSIAVLRRAGYREVPWPHSGRGPVLNPAKRLQRTH